jgi:hypothetical protein
VGQALRAPGSRGTVDDDVDLTRRARTARAMVVEETIHSGVEHTSIVFIDSIDREWMMVMLECGGRKVESTVNHGQHSTRQGS